MIPHTILKHTCKPQPIIVLAALAGLVLAGCKSKEQGDGAPPPNPQVIQVADMNLITIDKNDVPKFPVVAAETVETASQLKVAFRLQKDLKPAVPPRRS